MLDLSWEAFLASCPSFVQRYRMNYVVQDMANKEYVNNGKTKLSIWVVNASNRDVNTTQSPADVILKRTPIKNSGEI